MRNADRFERAHEVCTAALADTSSDSLHSEEGIELLTEHGLVLYQYQGIQSAIDQLAIHDRHLRGSSLELFAQCPVPRRRLEAKILSPAQYAEP